MDIDTRHYEALAAEFERGFTEEQIEQAPTTDGEYFLLAFLPKEARVEVMNYVNTTGQTPAMALAELIHACSQTLQETHA